MDRRTIIATAGAITLTVLAGSTAIAANVGILGSSPKTPVGQLSPVANLETPTGEGAGRVGSVDLSATTSTLPAQVETIYVDEYVPASPRSAGSSGAGDPAATTPMTPAPVSSAGVDDDSAGGDDGAVSEPAAEDGESEGADGQGDEYDDEHENDDDDEHESEDDEDEEYEGGADDD